MRADARCLASLVAMMRVGEQRLAGLADAHPSETEGQRRLRELVQEQITLAQQLAGQLESAKDRRARLWGIY